MEKELLAELAALKAENAKLVAERDASRKESLLKGIRFKVSAKKAISVYGFGRFPFTFYKEQVDRLFSAPVQDALLAFRSAHDAELAAKGDETEDDTATATL
jgi:hypothetical protein